MRKFKARVFIIAMIFVLSNLSLLVVAAQSPVIVSYNSERTIEFDDNWKFILSDNNFSQNINFDDLAWKNVNLPHDWSIELPFNRNSTAGSTGGALDGGTGWYRKTFTLPQSMNGKKVCINFDGVYMTSEVWINGKSLGLHPYGYTSFQYDLTSYLNFDGSPNVIAVRVTNDTPTSRWYSGSGIYRHVSLEVTNPVHVERWGTFVTTPTITTNPDLSNRADVNAVTTIANETGKEQEVSLLSTILDTNNEAIAKQTSINIIARGAKYNFKQAFSVSDAKLWSLEVPTMYTLKTEVVVEGKVIDTYFTPFGIRSFKFDPNNGFSLNGKSMKLQGVCLHHDLGSLGAAVNTRALERQLEIMKSMGVNAIRTSHNPPAPEFLDLADKMGILVMDEAFDCWDAGKNPNDYNLYYNDWAERDLKSMAMRDKNHPSIILWSIGNEIPLVSRTAENALKIKGWLQEIDTTRPVTLASNWGKSWGNPDPKLSSVLDVVGYNYGEKFYDENHKDHPEWVILGTETASAVRTRGVYHIPTGENLLKTPDFQNSNYDNSVALYGSSAEASWIADRDRKFVAGQFIWTGIDYIGEPYPYYEQAKSSYYGAVDTCGFPKDIYYFYQSQWTTKPMVHILPNWNGIGKKEGENIPVWAYTNAASVELYLNGKSQGAKKYNPSGAVLHLEWIVPYKPGIIKAVAKDANGNIVAEDEVRTAGKATSIVLKADKTVIAADGKDLVFIEADVVDKDGNLVPDADNKIDFEVVGGKIVGVDNGNPLSYESYKASYRKAFNGKCLVIVQAAKQAGLITVLAKSGAKGEFISNTIELNAHLRN